MTPEEIKKITWMSNRSLDDAMANIMAAREAKQAAEREQIQAAAIGVEPHRASVVWNKRYAQNRRKLAKGNLTLYEECQGMLFTNGYPYRSLKDALSGKNFREWPYYEKTFGNEGGGDIWG